jgi:hypoxanthine-DNA glycosylase
MHNQYQPAGSTVWLHLQPADQVLAPGIVLQAHSPRDPQNLRGNPVTPIGIATVRPRHDVCFPPVGNRDARVLILGSLPGRKSLQMQQYYAHPQNAFWKLIAQIFSVESSLPYTRKLRILTANRIALWDVLAAAERPGSLDSSIVHASARANDFAAFYRSHPRIRRVIFNGRKAEELYQRFVLPGLPAGFDALTYESLPSTSPAYAGMTFAKKLERWRTIKEKTR